MTMTIQDAYELPRPEDIRAMGFVIKLRELTAGTPELTQLVDDYVVTPAVARDLPEIFEKMKQVLARGDEYGRFIHGSFGSGKSHFMTMLALLCENMIEAWAKDHPVFKAMRKTHQGWVGSAHLLVVRIHMLSIKGKGTGLDRAVYDGFNEALRRRGKAPFEFLHVDGILDEARREAAQYGDVFWKNLATAGVVGGKDDFEAMAGSKSLKQREGLARAYLKFKGRDAASAGIDPRWSDGLARMAEHAKAQGFGGVVLMIDEFMLWLGEKSGQEFVEAINDLNVIVDHNTSQRAVPTFVFVARQRNIAEFFPDLVDEGKIHGQLDHHSKRFEITKLEDIELRHIVKERVLRPKAPEAIAAAIARLGQEQEKILPGLLNNPDVDLAYLKDVYPFHPALIETLIDVTELMQRERSALRLLYELLVIHYPHLPLGEFLPVGSAFDAIFPPSGVEASKKLDMLQDIHRQYYGRLVPAMKQMRANASDGGEFDEKRRVALEQLVKTVLLAEVSHRLKGKGLTIERLVQLNSVDVEGETYRGRLRVAAQDLVTLSNLVPDLQVSSTDKTAVVRYVLGGVSLGEVMARARSKVDNEAQRFRVFFGALKAALGVEKDRGFEDGGGNQGEYELRWRNTRRKGTLRLANVRELQYDDFEAPAGGFTVLVDYPWDEPGHSVEEDRQKATTVRRTRGNTFTACWLPRHMSPHELAIVTDLAAVRFLQTREGQDELLDGLAPGDRVRLVDQALSRERLLREQLEELLREVYVKHGEFFTLVSDIDTRRPHESLADNLDHIATLLMDRRYAQHPSFTAEPKKPELQKLLQWMVDAGDASTSVNFDEETAKALKSIGQPLELVNLGQTKASLRLDSRYIKDVLTRTDKDVVNWTEVADALREQYGFQPLILDLFLCFLCQRDHRALNAVSNDPIDVSIGMPASVAVRLERGKLVTPAEWSRLRELSVQLLEVTRPPAQRSLQQQDKLAATLRQRGGMVRTVLEGVHGRLGKLGVERGARIDEVAEANRRLEPLDRQTTDSHSVLTAFLALWPDRADDPIRAVVNSIEAARDALSGIDDQATLQLGRGRGHASVGTRVGSHLDELTIGLGAAHVERPLTKAWVTDWNRAAQALISEMITVTAPVSGGEAVRGPEPVPGPGPGPASRVLHNGVVDAADRKAVTAAIAQVKAALETAGRGRVRVSLVREED